MNNFLKNRIYNFILLLLISTQAFIYYYDNRPSSKVFVEKIMSVENFSSIILSVSGLTKIGSEELKKIDDNNLYLHGSSYLENQKYKIFGENIFIDLDKEVSHSNQPVKVINSMGVLRSNGFKNIDSDGKIYFYGQIIFESHE